LNKDLNECPPNITIFSPTGTTFKSLLLTDRAYGGADQTLLRLIHKILFSEYLLKAFIPVNKDYYNIENEDGEMQGVVRPFMKIFDKDFETDILIIYRKCWVIPRTVKYKKLIFYSQDDLNSPCFSGVTKDYFKPFDKIICLSQYHKNKFIEFGVDENKLIIIGNGANELSEKERTEIKKVPLNFIYCSTPFRGLAVLMKIWKDYIIKYFPNAKIHIFSSMKIYDGEKEDELFFNKHYEMIKKIKGVIYYGTQTQDKVLKCMKKCTALLYPNTFEETYCNVIMEARACETPFITSNKGALKETGGEAGIYINGNPYTSEYQFEFFKQLKYLIKNIQEYKNKCYPIRTWKDWEKEINEVLKNVIRPKV